jgi:carbonic anhydrase/acetyltransferase-like protein (isoleucine patch superfamily)
MLYGAEVGEGGTVTPHSVVMKGERLDPGLLYEGVPTRPAKAGVGPALTSS